MRVKLVASFVIRNRPKARGTLLSVPRANAFDANRQNEPSRDSGSL